MVKLKLTPRIKLSASILGHATGGRAKDAFRHTIRQPKHYIAHISWVEGKKQHVLNLSTPTPYVTDVINILRHIPQNTTNGKSLKKAKMLWINWSWLATSTKRKTGNPKQSIGE